MCATARLFLALTRCKGKVIFFYGQTFVRKSMLNFLFCYLRLTTAIEVWWLSSNWAISLCTDSGEPLLDRFSLLARDGLNNADLSHRKDR